MSNSVCFLFTFERKINSKDTFSNFLLPEYEKNCFAEYINGNEEKLIYSNPNEVKLTYLLNLMVN